MKVMLDIKNSSKIVKPSRNDVIIHDGENWYITTKEDLLGEMEKKLEDKLQEYNYLFTQANSEINELKKTVSKQLLEMSEIIKNMLEGK